MAFAAKFTGRYGSTERGEIAVATGDAEAGRDTISINMDVDKMGKAEAVHLIEKVRDKVLSMPWPPVA